MTKSLVKFKTSLLAIFILRFCLEYVNSIPHFLGLVLPCRARSRLDIPLDLIDRYSNSPSRDSHTHSIEF